MIASSYPRFEGDGTGSFIRSLARALVGLGLDVVIVAPYDPAVAPLGLDGVHLHRFRYAPLARWHLAGHGRALHADIRLKGLVPLLMPGYVLAALAKAWSLHHQESFDILHGHWAVPGGAIAALGARLWHLPLVVSLHGSDVYLIQKSALAARVAHLGFERAACVTACSQDLRDRAVDAGLDVRRSLVIPYGVDVATYAGRGGNAMRERLGIPMDAPVIGALGRLVAKKGFRYLISALPDILKTIPDARCVIGGEGDLRDALIQQIHVLKLMEHVLLPGHIEWQRTPEFIAMCDVFVVPSVVDEAGNVDGLPNVLLEAMAGGRAVVGSHVAGIPEAIQDGETGLLVPPGDVAALSQALCRLLGDAALRARLGRAAQEAVARTYTWEAIAKRFVAIYERALVAPRAS